MMSGPHLRIVTPPATMAIEQPRQPLRLKLKPKAPTTGCVDGAWWPRSLDLSTELPALLAVLAIRLGDIRRVHNINSIEELLALTVATSDVPDDSAVHL